MKTNITDLGEYLLLYGKHVDTGHWQAMKGVPQTKTVELMNVVYQLGIPQNKSELRGLVLPSEPWAELQFQERVAGLPVNPGETYKLWPWYRGNVDQHKAQGLFSHTYMERFWPKQIPHPQVLGIKGHRDMLGVRYPYGDLNDVIDLLAREPYTRQAYLPVFFPEDTGAHHGERIPCSLGYHFLLREGKLHINYTIRSCDFLRHFRDDVYMAARLCQWVLNELQDYHNTVSQDEGLDWDGVIPGTLTMMMHSLHVFEGDLPKMRREYG